MTTMAAPTSVPPQLDPLHGPGCGCGCGGCGCDHGPQRPPAPPVGPQVAAGAVRYASGEVVLSVKDSKSDGFGVPWGHTRSFASQLSQNTNAGNGTNWQVKEWSYLVVQGDTVVVMGESTKQKWFTKVGSDFVSQFSTRETLILDAANNVYKLIDLEGGITEYAAATGGFLRHTDPYGNATEAVGFLLDGFHFAEIRRSYTSGEGTTTESFLYSWDDESSPNPLLTGVLLRQQVGDGDWTNVSQALYTYYAAGDPSGSQGDLETVLTQDWNGSSWDTTGTTLYRHHLPPSSSASGSARAGAGQLPRHVLSPASYAKLVADGHDPSTVSDAILATYADQYFEYNESGQVSKLVTDGGTMTHLFTYEESGFPDGYNSWKFKTTETLQDSSQRIVYANYAGQTMLSIFQAGADQWSDFYQYTADGLVSMHANPSAVIPGPYDQYADLLNFVGGSYEYLHQSAGLIETFQYHAPTGHLASEQVQNGQSGTPIAVRQYEYVSVSGTTPPIYWLSQEVRFPSEDSGGPQILTTYSYTAYPGTSAVQERVTTLPVIPTTQNGSGIANTRKDYFDTYGHLTWHADERGYLTSTAYDILTGAAVQQIDDVDTTRLAAPPGWSTPSEGGLHLITDITIDSEGRPTQILGPDNGIDLGGVATSVRRTTWNVYKVNPGSPGQQDTLETQSAQGYATGTSPNYTYTLVNPVSIVITDLNNRPLQQVQATRPSTDGPLLPSDSFPQSSYVRWTVQDYADGFHLSSQRVYKLIPPTDAGAGGVNYDETDFGYDLMLRTNRNVTPGGTITRSVFDARDNPVSTWVGTDDTGATDSDPAGGGVAPNNMVQVSAFQYDAALAGGDNNLTQESRYVDDSTSRVSNFIYDWRNRRTDTQGPVDFYEKVYYDNMGRLIKTERYDTSLAGNLIARTDVNFDDLSRVQQTVYYAVNPATGAIGGAVWANTWYDPCGNPMVQFAADRRLFTKTSYDSLGRLVRTCFAYSNVIMNYPDGGNVAKDTVVEQIDRTYDFAGNLIQTTNRQRYHNASGLGALGGPTGSQPLARVAHTAFYPDALGRVQATADFGTNGGVSLSRPATVPQRSDTVLVTNNVFDDAGNLLSTTDPAGKTTQFSYDNVGRELQRVLNYAGSSGAVGACLPSLDVNITIETGYNSDGNVSQITARNSQTGDQVTQFVYGTSLNDSGIASSLLKRYEVYPDSVSGNDQLAFTYNRQGQIATKTDQLGTVHAYEYDLLGRQIEDLVTTLAPGVDDAVRRIQTGYEVRGMVQTVTSSDIVGTIANQVQLAYNDFGQLIADYQSHMWAVDVATTPKVQYSYTNAPSSMRRVGITYPNGRSLGYNYGPARAINDACNRVETLFDNDGTTHLADYSYLGLGSIIAVGSPQAQLQYTLIGTAGGNDPDTGDIYRGLDRFGRVKDLIWQQTSTSTVLERIQHAYDRAGNRLNRANLADSSRLHDELYNYDGVNRLHDMGRGTLNAAGTDLLPKTFGQCWTLDETGNWANFREDVDGNGTWDLVQNRTSSQVNAITSLTNTTGSPWEMPKYDAVGNMTTIPQPGNPESGFTAVYDAWNRLISLTAGGLVYRNQYDGLNRRVLKMGTYLPTIHQYYSANWQVVEEVEPPMTTPRRQYVWGMRYVDDLVLRDRDATWSGTLGERLYALQDPNWNVTAVMDTAGSVQERYAYAVYGMPSFLTAAFGNKSSSSFEWETLFGGYRWDADTGLFHVRARSYGSNVGAWLQRDPFALGAGDVNLYRFVGNQPTEQVDPTGLIPNQAESTDPSWLLKFVTDLETKTPLTPMEILAGLKDAVTNNGNRYVYTDTYGWVDLRHMGMAAALHQSFNSISPLRSGGAVVWLCGFFHELINDFGTSSFFSPEDMPSNSAGISLALEIEAAGNKKLSVVLADWLKRVGARAKTDPVAGLTQLPVRATGATGFTSNPTSVPMPPFNGNRPVRKQNPAQDIWNSIGPGPS
jgi:RHS repeat-associated protein